MANIYGPLTRAQLESSASDLTPAATGLIYYNTTVGPKIYDGSVWKILADLDSAQVFTNKDYDGGTASNTSRVTIPKATKATLDGLSRKQATLVYATDQNKYYGDDGVQLRAVGSGTGEKNYVTNSDDSGNWAASGAGVTVSTVTTAALLPEESKASGIKLLGVSGTDYARYRFTLDDGDKSKKLKIQFYIKSDAAYASDDFEVQMWTNTASNYAGTYAQLQVQKDVQIFKSDAGCLMLWTFDSDASDYYEFRIVRNAGTSFIVISGVIVGPGTISKGAVISDAVSFTPVWANATPSGSNSAATYTRIGEYMLLQLATDFSAGGAGSGVTVDIPLGLNVNTAHASLQTDASGQLGTGIWTNSGSFDGMSATFGGVTDKLTFVRSNNGAAIIGTNINPGDNINISVLIPILEWAGSGTMNILVEDNLTNWTSYTPTFGGVGTPTGVYFEWRRLGGDVQIRGRFIVDVPSGGAAADIGLPPGLNILTTNLSNHRNSFGDWHQLGGASEIFATATASGVLGYSGGAGTTAVRMSTQAAGNNYAEGIASAFLSGGFPVDIPLLTIPIAEFQNGQNGLVGFAGATLTTMGLQRKAASGFVQAALTGFTTGADANTTYSIQGDSCTISIAPNSATSNATTMTITGLPAYLLPATVSSYFVVSLEDNGSAIFGEMAVTPSGISFYTIGGGGFTAAGIKGPFQGVTVTYPLT